MKEVNTYGTHQLLEILGVSRDALRYYEEKGVIKPKRKEDGNYREYGFYDIYNILVTDFYKKRNLSIKEVKMLQEGSDIDELESLLEEKAKEVEEIIYTKERMLQKINETKAFCKNVKNHINQYSLRELPIYEVKGEISDFKAFQEYPVILGNMDLMNDDILSKIMTRFTFDRTGFLDSKLYIVEQNVTNQKEQGKSYLEYSNCIYTIVEDGRYQNGDTDIKYNSYESVLVWADEHGLKPIGIAFANTRLITYFDNKERVFLEIYIPIEDK